MLELCRAGRPERMGGNYINYAYLERDDIINDQLIVPVDQAYAVIAAENRSQTLREIPRLAILRGNDDFTGLDIDIAALAFLVAIYGQAVPPRKALRIPSGSFWSYIPLWPCSRCERYCYYRRGPQYLWTGYGHATQTSRNGTHRMQL